MGIMYYSVPSVCVTLPLAAFLDDSGNSYPLRRNPQDVRGACDQVSVCLRRN